MKKNKICWVWRRSYYAWDFAKISPSKPEWDSCEGTWFHEDAGEVCYAFFKKATGLTLKVGEDPIRVRFNVEVLD